MLDKGLDIRDCLEHFLTKQREEMELNSKKEVETTVLGEAINGVLEAEEEAEAISIVKALLNHSDLNYHLALSMMMAAKVKLNFFMNYPKIQEILNYIAIK